MSGRYLQGYLAGVHVVVQALWRNVCQSQRLVGFGHLPERAQPVLYLFVVGLADFVFSFGIFHS